MTHFDMEVHIQPEEEAQLTEIAAQRGVTTDKLVHQIISRYLEDDKRFVKAVKVGITAADRGDLVEDAEVRSRLKCQLEGGLGTELAALFSEHGLDSPIPELRGFTIGSPFESAPKKAAGLRPADSRGRLSPHKPARKPRKKRA